MRSKTCPFGRMGPEKGSDFRRRRWWFEASRGKTLAFKKHCECFLRFGDFPRGQVISVQKDTSFCVCAVKPTKVLVLLLLILGLYAFVQRDGTSAPTQAALLVAVSGSQATEWEDPKCSKFTLQTSKEKKWEAPSVACGLPPTSFSEKMLTLQKYRMPWA